MTPAAYLASQVESTAPAMDLTDPAPVNARQATRRLIAEAGLSADVGDGLIGAVSEVVTNAALHGAPPVRVRGWVQDGRAVVTVSDTGAGPTDPLVGLQPMPRDPGEGGFGLFLARQMCSELTMGRHDGGFTVRLEAGARPSG